MKRDRVDKIQYRVTTDPFVSVMVNAEQIEGCRYVSGDSFASKDVERISDQGG